MEGAIFGFIQQNNDPRYRLVEWGSGRDYWIRRLRALAFSAVMSTQWKIGPASEASLGNVQPHESGGFTDLVNIPTLGVCAMMGEDVTDRHGVQRAVVSSNPSWAFRENFVLRKKLL
jgi:hypothetical protein